MSRAVILVLAMSALQGLVVLHWWLWPQNGTLGLLALGAGILMVLAAGMEVLLLLRLLRLPAQSRMVRESLAEYGELSPLWLAALGVSAAFGAVAWHFGVRWVALAVLVWACAELGVTLLARLRGGGTHPA